MPRNMSFALTTPQFLDGSKTETRRTGWQFLEAGDKIMAVEKGMGIPKGQKIRRLGPCTIVSVHRESLKDIKPADVIAEGFPDMTPAQFIKFFCDSHKNCTPLTPVTVIRFKRDELVLSGGTSSGAPDIRLYGESAIKRPASTGDK